MGETPCETFCVLMHDLEFFWRIFNPYTNVQISFNSLSEAVLPVNRSKANRTCNTGRARLIRTRLIRSST